MVLPIVAGAVVVVGLVVAAGWLECCWRRLLQLLLSALQEPPESPDHA